MKSYNPNSLIIVHVNMNSFKNKFSVLSVINFIDVKDE